jgi:hypothetical protein
MSTWAVIAAKEAAVASGVSAGIIPAIGNSAVDGFAVGTLLSGACFMLVAAQRRTKLQKRYGAGQNAGVLAALPPSPSSIGSFGDESAETLVPGQPGADQEPADLATDGRTSYRSRHRLTDPAAAADRWPDARRGAPKHAAPSISFSDRMASLFTVRQVAVRS